MGRTVVCRMALASKMDRIVCVSYSCSSNPNTLFDRCRNKAFVSQKLPSTVSPPLRSVSKNSNHLSFCHRAEGLSKASSLLNHVACRLEGLQSSFSVVVSLG